MVIDSSATRSRLAKRCLRACSAIGRLIAARIGRAQAVSDRALRIEESLSLGQKKILYLVKCRDREYLIAAGGDAIASVLEIAAESNGKKAPVAQMQKRERLP